MITKGEKKKEEKKMQILKIKMSYYIVKMQLNK